MAITESKANFASRATALGLDEAVLSKFVGSGIDCMSKYAFLSSFVPGNTDEKPFTDAVVKVLGRDPSIAELSVLHRLLHESYNLTVSELQVQVERTDDSAPRKLAAPDRADRLQRQQLRLSGLNIHGPMLPGHAVIDKCVKFKKDRDDKMLSVDGAGHVSLRRVVLVAFSMSAIDKLSPEAAARLTSLQFALPSRDDVEHFRRYPQLPARLPWPPRFPLQVRPFSEVPVQAPAACSAVAPPPGESLFLELCAGTAMLSRCFREAGVPVMPIDHQHNRHHPLAKVCNLSLTEDSTWSFLSDLVRDHAILFVHAAPPCGTCSMARSIKRKGVSAAPLRSPQSFLPTGSSSSVAEAPADGSLVSDTAVQPSSFEVRLGLVSDTAVQPSSFEVRLGVFASPEEFVQDCRTVGHPFDRLHSVSDRLRQCLFDMLIHGPAWVVRRRANLLKKWTVWASELEFDEKELRDSLDPEVAKVLQGKRLLLLL
eukprot:s9557_g1.t1